MSVHIQASHASEKASCTTDRTDTSTQTCEGKSKIGVERPVEMISRTMTMEVTSPNE
jgi:hypothetical protein